MPALSECVSRNPLTPKPLNPKPSRACVSECACRNPGCTGYLSEGGRVPASPSLGAATAVQLSASLPVSGFRVLEFIGFGVYIRVSQHCIRTPARPGPAPRSTETSGEVERCSDSRRTAEVLGHDYAYSSPRSRPSKPFMSKTYKLDRADTSDQA